MSFIDDAYHITRADADLYVEQVGDRDGRAILYLHGGPGYSSYSFRDLLGDALEQHRMIYADQRGGGRSYTDTDFGLDDLGDDVRAVLAALDTPAATLLAHGFGGAVAVNTAVRHPDSVERLVLVNPWFSMPVLARTLQRTAARLADREEEALPADGLLDEAELADAAELADQAFGLAAAKRVFDALQFPHPAARLRLEHSDSNALSGPAESPGLRDPWHVDVTPLLGGLRLPVVMIAGRQDGTCVPAQAELGLERMPSALFSLVDGGHYPWLDDPETFLSVLAQALAS